MSLVDLKGRTIEYLRLSITDRCNYRCVYCLPAGGFDRVGRDALLQVEELVRVAQIFASLGVHTVRITGGEPTVRGGLLPLIEGVAAIEGVRDLALTTNGDRLVELAAPLRAAGLTRLNVSLDTLDPDRHHTLTRGGQLGRVLEGLDAALEVGFKSVKLNTVLLRGVNDDEAEALIDFAWSKGIVPRFIELMPLGEAGRQHGPEAVVSSSELLGRLSHRLHPAPAPGRGPGSGPALYYPSLDDPALQVGLIGAVSEKFCAGCNRVRVTSQGSLRGCLARPEGVDLRSLLRDGASDDALAEMIRAAVLGRRDGHDFWEAGADSSSDLVVMTGIGG